MTGNAHNPRNDVQEFNPSDFQQLTQEIGSLRAIVAELLAKNQLLRWELLQNGCWATQDSRLLMASEGTPVRKYSRTVAIP
jgi:hypothetical protein